MSCNIFEAPTHREQGVPRVCWGMFCQSGCSYRMRWLTSTGGWFSATRRPRTSQTLDGPSIREAGGPVHPGDLLLLLDVCENPSYVRSGVGALQTSARSHGLQSRLDEGAHDFVPVA